jgi:CheY-like chemotaxis protein
MKRMKKVNCIMLIDDDNINNFLNYRIIKKWDISDEINILNNGRDAIRFIDNWHFNFHNYPELILLDINMPVMDGFEFLEALEKRQLSGKTKIIVLTTADSFQDIEKMKEFGVNYFFNKPLDEKKLQNLLVC